MYPMLFGVCLIAPATPSLPLPPRPTGQFTDAFTPTLDFHSGLTLDKKSTHTNVVPLPSDRWMTTMSLLGRFTPGLAFFNSGSLHFVILPRKIPAKASGVKLSSCVTPGML